MLPRILLTVIGLGVIGPSLADIDDSAYDIASKRISADKRRAMEADIEREQKREEERARLVREATARAEAERQATLAARPYPVRLLEKRCTVCHAENRYREKAHTWPGWLLVVMRMRYLNDAIIEPAELSTVVSHLAAEHPAEGLDVVLEYAALPVAALLAGGVIWLGGLRRRRR